MNYLELSSRIAPLFKGEDTFDQILGIDGEAYRQFANRRTLRIELGGYGYFIKIHLGVGWKEIFKCLLTLRQPVVDARRERVAIDRLVELGVDTMTIAGFGVRGLNPANRQSFLITEELVGSVSLEHYCNEWTNSPPTAALKKALISKVAWIASRLHGNGVNHRDFYLCHFHLDLASIESMGTTGSESPLLYVIDLHRAQVRKKTPRRWRDKDLVGLYFSAMDINLSRRDLLRFMRAYSREPARCYHRQKDWHGIHVRACRLYEKIHGRKSPLLDIWS